MIQNTNKHVENSCRYWNNEKEARAGISDLRQSFSFTFSPFGQVSRSVYGSYMINPLQETKQNKYYSSTFKRSPLCEAR